jgi:hypothetical protein
MINLGMSLDRVMLAPPEGRELERRARRIRSSSLENQMDEPGTLPTSEQEKAASLVNMKEEIVP